ncbi:TolB family protein [Arthrobacter sp. NPDC058288]|uniref:TolB family protein n=1 Tax=Arthrobacter sp. NPDC058288 TaxID=3346424 RepID=UPI0036E3DE46
MSPGSGRQRWIILLVITAVVLAGAGSYAVIAFQRFQESRSAASAVSVASGGVLPAAAFVLFRNTAPGQGYGMAATVPLGEPAGQRYLAPEACDRIYGTARTIVCLKTNRGLVTNFEALLLNRDWQTTSRWAVPGMPSRTRMSADGSLVSATVFVTGHSYGASGFSTETSISRTDGSPVTGSLEGFALLVNGAQVTAADRNIWGVTFVPGDGDAFYATAASSGRIWLVKGSISARTLTAIHDGVECPSVSPDGTRVAYKKNTGTPLAAHWKIAILDLADGNETVLSEARSVDDQVEWLDDGTLLYGLPRDGAEGDSDIWQIGADRSARASLYIEHAWSPSVVR